ncbi:Crp/Fnr family transcriptional regulator [Vibrio hyugaensis]|uniref:Crp/Fnr family transcriptional regulator n=1 Tax=Vibrio hyugaensis TaxID=1534743 RepID=UPI003DA18AEA
MSYPDFENLLVELGLNALHIESLLSNFKSAQLKKGHHILNINDVFSHVYLLSEGSVRFYYLTPDGNEANKLFLFDRDIFFPIAPIARNRPSLFGIVTCEQTHVRYIDFEQFRVQLTTLDIWDKFYMTYLEWLVDAKVDREYRLLTLGKSELIYELSHKEPQVFERISDCHIASYLGMSPVTFSRLKHSP